MASIRKRGNNYQIRVYLGKDSNGKQISKSFTWHPNPLMTKKQQEKELQKVVFEYETKMKSTSMLKQDISLENFMELWLKDYGDSNLSACTMLRYRNLTKRIYECLGNIRLQSLEAYHLLEFYNHLRNEVSETTHKPLSEQTIRQYHRFISSVLSTAVSWQFLETNVALRIKMPKNQGKEAFFLNQEQTLHLLDLVNDEPEPYRTMINLLLYTGLRRSELMGLDWNDVDFKNGIISVQRVRLYTAEKGIFAVDKLKNGSKCRVIPVGNRVLDILSRYKIWQNKNCHNIGEDSPVFTKENGEPFHPDRLTCWFGRFIRRTDLPYITIHSLRHTNATLLIGAGVNIKTVSNRLGHAKSSTTCNIYTHTLQTVEAKAAEKMDEIFHSQNFA